MQRSIRALRQTGVRLPGYNRAALRPGLIHVGLGVFHRCHQAEYLEDLLEAGLEQRFTTGITLRPPEMEPLLAPQNGLYTQTLVEADTRTVRVIGGLGDVLDAATDSAGVLRALADPAMTVATLTVTEKGYCHIPATGKIDTDHPDIRADSATPHTPVSLPGVLVEALARRQHTGAGGMTLISCDNVPGNGRVLRGVVMALARSRGNALADWVAQNIRFPSTMVDRIVPATTQADRDRLFADTGLRDAAPVIGEPFRQWVIEECGATDLPRWDRAGATFATNVEGHELIKMRLLNGAQSAMAHIGCLLGLATTCDGINHPALRRLLLEMLHYETAPTLPVIAGMEAGLYIKATVRRLENRAIRHTNHQIATDGSQKIVQRLLRPAAERLAKGLAADRLIAASAAWAAYLACGHPRYGARWHPVDPFADRIIALSGTSQTPQDLAAQVLRIRDVFVPELADHPDFRRCFTTAFVAWVTLPAAQVLDLYCPAD